MHPPRITRLPVPVLAVLAGAAVLASVLSAAGCGQSAAAPGAPVPASAIGRPPALSAPLLLPSQTMAAGSSMTGHVLVDNHTGHAIHTFGCLSLFQVALTSGSYRPTVAWAACLQRFTIPAGKARYRVTVWASYSQCSEARPRHGLKACLPGGRRPPLPPGTYQARLFQARPLVRIPPPITVRVMPARAGSAAAARLAGAGSARLASVSRSGRSSPNSIRSWARPPAPTRPLLLAAVLIT